MQLKMNVFMSYIGTIVVSVNIWKT